MMLEVAGGSLIATFVLAMIGFRLNIVFDQDSRNLGRLIEGPKHHEIVALRNRSESSCDMRGIAKDYDLSACARC